MALDRDSFFARWNLIRGLAWGGQYERAIELAPALLRESGRHQWVLGALAWTYGKQGRPELAAAVLAELEARARLEFVAPFWLAVSASSAGDDEKAVKFMERTVAERDALVIWANLSPFWDRLRANPRYLELTRQLWV